MSDLEKYFALALWADQRVEYDWDFWYNGYNFDFYRHQWDAYGAMDEDETSVCVGIAIFYSNLCHAADLPCRFVRTNPDFLEHTIKTRINYLKRIMRKKEAVSSGLIPNHIMLHIILISQTLSTRPLTRQVFGS